MTDNEMVLQAKKGNCEAFCGLAEVYGPSVYMLCFQMLQDYDFALDSALDTFRVAWNAVSLLGENEDYQLWLLRLAFCNVTDNRKGYIFNAKASPQSMAMMQRQALSYLLKDLHFTPLQVSYITGLNEDKVLEIECDLSLSGDDSPQVHVPETLADSVRRLVAYEDHRFALKKLPGRFRFTILAAIFILIFYLILKFH